MSRHVAESAPSAVATGYTNRAATSTAITTVLRSLHISLLYRWFSTPIQSHYQQRCHLATTPRARNTCAKNVAHHLEVGTIYSVIYSSPPSPKRAKKEEDTIPRHPLVEDPPARLPFAGTLSTELLDVVRVNWSAIRTRVARDPLQCRFNYRLTTLDTTVLEEPLEIMFQEQTHSFKINLSYGFILRNKDTGQYRYYHFSCNCCGRYLDEPRLVTNHTDFDEFLEHIRETDVLQWTITQRHGYANS